MSAGVWGRHGGKTGGILGCLAGFYAPIRSPMQSVSQSFNTIIMVLACLVLFHHTGTFVGNVNVVGIRCSVFSFTFQNIRMYMIRLSLLKT